MNNQLISKIGLGTVQFGLDYGVANHRGKIPSEEVCTILDFARRQGIACLDTAASYGSSETVIGKYLQNRSSPFRIVSKLPALEQFEKGVVAKCLQESLALLQQKDIYGFLLHRFEDVRRHKHLWQEMTELKMKGQVKRIGFSLYKPLELEWILQQKIPFDLVQVPYSIFDRRFQPCLALLKEKGVEIHVRSIFLQGLCFLSPENLPSQLQGARQSLTKLRKLSQEQNISVSAVCLNFALAHSGIDQVILGVDSLKHLQNNLAQTAHFEQIHRQISHFEALAIQDEGILLPGNWGMAK